MLHSRPKILLVDDDEVAVMAFERAFAQQGLSIPLVVARDGDEALEILSDPARLSPPVVVVLDLNMPRMNGHDVLKHLRANPTLRETVVFVQSTSDAPEDIARAYEKNIAGYIVKEDAYRSIAATVALLETYLRTVTLPDRNFAKN